MENKLEAKFYDARKTGAETVFTFVMRPNDKNQDLYDRTMAAALKAPVMSEWRTDGDGKQYRTCWVVLFLEGETVLATQLIYRESADDR